MVRYIVEDDEQTIQETSAAAYLVLMVEERQSQVFPLRGLVYLGRDKSNSVVVSDKKVSRHHATLTPIEETFILTDQGSANGTYLNGVLISQPTRLKHRDRIGIGDTTFLFTTKMPEKDPSSPESEIASTVHRPVHTDSAPSSQSPSFSHVSQSSQSALAAVGLAGAPLWLLIGCMAVVIVTLLLVLATLLGLLVGRSQLAAALIFLV